jgi:4-hydroxy-tetrahydrodipicolinate synthase
MSDNSGGGIAGLFAAVATPIHGDGRIDFDTFGRLIDFLVEAGVAGVCLGGATGEYPHFETEDRKAIVRYAARHLPRDRALIVGIGGPSVRHTIDLGETALQSGSRGLLLPMPMFFRYDQEDLKTFCMYVSDALRGPCLLYNLPDFTNDLEPDTVVSLLRDAEFIVGIKDSSGQIEHLNAFAAARGSQAWTLLVGDDRALYRGLQTGWNGGISGVAGFCPELLVALYRSHVERRFDETARLQVLLDELISQIAPLPTPWGIRVGLAARGIDTGPLPLPLSAARTAQIAAFRKWLPEWLVQHGLDRSVDAAAKITGR